MEQVAFFVDTMPRRWSCLGYGSLTGKIEVTEFRIYLKRGKQHVEKQQYFEGI
jgi:hypothetical protein